MPVVACRELKDLMRIVEDSPSHQEQHAALKLVARIAAMSPQAGAMLVSADLIMVIIITVVMQDRCQQSTVFPIQVSSPLSH